MSSIKLSIRTILIVMACFICGCSSPMTPKELSYKILFNNKNEPNYKAISAAIDSRFPPGSLVKDVESFVHTMYGGGCGLYDQKELSFCEITVECKYSFQIKFEASEGVIQKIKTTGGIQICD